MILIRILGIFLILACFCITIWCFANAPSKEDMDDYYNAIMKETMHELNEYDTRKR